MKITARHIQFYSLKKSPPVAPPSLMNAMTYKAPAVKASDMINGLINCQCPRISYREKCELYNLIVHMKRWRAEGRAIVKELGRALDSSRMTGARDNAIQASRMIRRIMMNRARGTK